MKSSTSPPSALHSRCSISILNPTTNNWRCGSTGLRPLTMDHFHPTSVIRWRSVSVRIRYAESRARTSLVMSCTRPVLPTLIQREIVASSLFRSPMMRTPPLASKIPSTIRITQTDRNQFSIWLVNFTLRENCATCQSGIR